MKNKIIFLSIFLCLSLCFSVGKLFASDKVRIVTTTATIADLVRQIAGDYADIYFIASPKRDIHFIAPTPKDVLKVKKAQVFVHSGLDLEAWRGPLLDAVGRTDLMWPSGNKQIDVSKGISLLEIPSSLSRAQGDQHAYGNPHYATDPVNAKIMVGNIAEGLSTIFPDQGATFQKNADDLNQKIDEKMKDWTNRMSSYQETPIVTYHRDWSYFNKRFGLIVIGEVEPKPGIPPTAKHMASLINSMKEKNVKIIMTESFRESRAPAKIAQATGAKVVTLAQDVGETKEGKDYIAMVEQNIHLLEGALTSKKGS